MGAPRARALCLCFGGALDFQTGRWTEARTELEEAIDLYRKVGSASGESLSLQRFGVLLTAIGETDRAQDVINDGIVVAERAAMRSHCLTRLHATMTRNRLAAGDLEAATASLAEGLEAARRHGHCVTCNALVLPEGVRVELARNDINAARVHADELAEIASSFDSQAWTAMATHARARVLAAEGDNDKAFDAFERAADSFLEVEQVYEAARCRMGQSKLRDGAEAAALQARATQVLTELGAAALEV